MRELECAVREPIKPVAGTVTWEVMSSIRQSHLAYIRDLIVPCSKKSFMHLKSSSTDLTNIQMTSVSFLETRKAS